MLQKYANQRKAAGICLKCGNPVGREGYATCAECGKYSATAQRAARMYREKHGLCVMCGKVPPENGYKSCSVCREYNRRARQKSRMRKESM